MVQVRRHEDAGAFLERAESWLLRREAEHNLILGLSTSIAGGDLRFPGPNYFATVENGEEVVGCALRTPPHKLLLTRLPEEGFDPLARDVGEVYDSLPAVLGEETTAWGVARAWAEPRGLPCTCKSGQRIHELFEVSALAGLPEGRMVPGTQDHLSLVAKWLEGFKRDVGDQVLRVHEQAQRLVSGRLVYLWSDGEPRSMASCVSSSPTGCRIGAVYTPEDHRGRGYATALVAVLSQKMLDEGRDACFLYTDIANPTSNKIYARIGYRPVCDVVDVHFAHGDPPSHSLP